jgi:catechol 2,3-dioxygenase-like lactoylglutathione lyase family enzyme
MVQWSSLMLEKISAVTLATADMRRAVDFYSKLGFSVLSGGPEGDFTSFRVGDGYLNLALRPEYAAGTPWGRTIFYVSDVDAFYDACIAAGLQPEAPPRDAEWHERYFHIVDPDGHELSFAKPLSRS